VVTTTHRGSSSGELDPPEDLATTLRALLRRDRAQLSELIKHRKSLCDGPDVCRFRRNGLVYDGGRSLLTSQEPVLSRSNRV
jgi:hypothetical protein